MSDGMTEGHRANLRNEITRGLFVELLACVTDHNRTTDALRALADEADNIRGDMIGTTNWSVRISGWVEALRSDDGAAWDYVYRFVPKHLQYCQTDEGIVDLYSAFKKIHCFEAAEPLLI